MFYNIFKIKLSITCYKLYFLVIYANKVELPYFKRPTFFLKEKGEESEKYQHCNPLQGNTTNFSRGTPQTGQQGSTSFKAVYPHTGHT